MIDYKAIKTASLINAQAHYNNKSTASVKEELDFYIREFPGETAGDHLEAILRDITNDLHDFIQEQDVN